MISNDRLGSAVQDGQDLIGIKILSDKAHLPFLKRYSSQLMISGSLCQFVSNLNSLSLRMTVEVEIESLWAISAMACFSTSN